MVTYVLVFDFRSDDGPPRVGPFASREAAFAYAATIGGTLEYEAQPMVAPESDRLLTVEEIAQILRVSQMTVYRLAHSGKLTSIRVGNSFRITQQAVEDYLTSG